jgi:inhibitor of cysteine peptidase
MKLFSNLLLSLLVFFASAFAFAQNQPLTTSDPQKSIMVGKSNPTFTIILSSNPTTGYSWFLKSIDTDLIKPVNKVFIAPNKGLIGAGGYEKWTFQIKPGGFSVPQNFSITMVYARPWEMQGVQISTFKVVTNDN